MRSRGDPGASYSSKGMPVAEREKAPERDHADPKRIKDRAVKSPQNFPFLARR